MEVADRSEHQSRLSGEYSGLIRIRLTAFASLNVYVDQQGRYFTQYVPHDMVPGGDGPSSPAPYLNHVECGGNDSSAGPSSANVPNGKFAGDLIQNGPPLSFEQGPVR
jgi:hypothetical protein